MFQVGRDATFNAAPVEPPGGPEGRLWNVAGAVATFTARDVELASVTTAVSDNPGVPVVLHGMPGVGKTQLALAWVYAHAGSAKVVWQIRAANRLEVVADLAQLADRLGAAVGEDLEQAARAAVHELNGRDDWLLLFDDATPDSVAGLVPVRGGRVLMTSRNPNWAPTAVPLEVGLFAPHAAAVFLDPSAGEAAARLAGALGYLPLALEQARAYCAATGRDLSGYLADFRRQRLLGRGIDHSLHAPVTVTLALALEETRRRELGAAQLMMVLVQFAPVDVPRDLVAASAAVLPAPLAAATHDGVYADQVIRVLRELALVTTDRSGLLRVHQLVAEVMREHPMPVPYRYRLWQRLLRTVGVGSPPQSWFQVGANLLAEALPADVQDPVSWDRWALLLPHAEAVIERSDSPSTTISTLQHLCGSYLYERGEYLSARRYFTHAVEVRSQLLGADDRAALASMCSLAILYRETGEVAAARELDEKVLPVFRRVLGEEHPATLGLMNNLALDLHDLGEVAAARELDEKVLAGWQRVLGEEHPDTLQSLNNLALDLHDLGEVAAARELDEKALAGRRRVLGEEHPNTLNSMGNLARDLRALGEVAAARELDEKALAGCRRVLGEEHPNTLDSMGNLARDLRALGEVAAARELDEKALAGCRRVLGEEHPNTLDSMGNLARDLRALGEVAAARELDEKVLAGCRRVLGEEHPNTLDSMGNLAAIEREMGDPDNQEGT
ncbi:FxSxx-COOH system tetratricopeptide repeat protein [Actinoplanes oblitus]|uniref:FxSxx-COOH system tetratricopeptide repeat protein n=1 Tax=Actinoplanes oblitus TaxID=3040509 RepID=A0ABY8WTJ8_9ACTN|nr:FxSxx-COOH system tetratricopeptide repeat protein [Actinoplanes oblitus]WIN00138.1 FxSxx-COOH system tetratricopeptide repeat protein [Actinoplanes oblitus]